MDKPIRPAALLAAAALGLAACSGTASTGSSASAGASKAGSDTITVLAAASLKESFDQIATDYEAAHPGVDVQVSYGGSSALAKQITDGSPVDVFASASTRNMDTVVAAGKAKDPVTFASNVLEIAVPPANPGKVDALADLTDPELKLALCQAEVPCGVASTKLFTQQKMSVTATTQEPDVKSVLTKVRLGEVDAGLVYATDVKAAGDQVKGIEIPADQNVSTSYPIAVLTDAPRAEQAKGFVDLVLSEQGRSVLEQAGFQRP
ncbi:molybdate ABC transporter substrate-binding protein [Luteococcus peritonei]|uniref:Molybdate ABC transporter substrate-binding protein n=1 Tax=Luteococcus peritonei TaxID=88874 RepID=A0ABW4RTD0_9ACTN